MLIPGIIISRHRIQGKKKVQKNYRKCLTCWKRLGIMTVQTQKEHSKETKGETTMTKGYVDLVIRMMTTKEAARDFLIDDLKEHKARFPQKYTVESYNEMLNYIMQATK